MTEQGLKYLSDIFQAIILIEEFTFPTKDYNSFIQDRKTQSAVERQLGIIGEALNKYDSLKMAERVDNSRKIIGFRNRLIHAYDAVDSAMVWAIIKNHLPVLKIEVSQLLR